MSFFVVKLQFFKYLGIIDELKNPITGEQMRPHIPKKCEFGPKLSTLLKDCWTENTLDRPDINQAKLIVYEVTKAL